MFICTYIVAQIHIEFVLKYFWSYFVTYVILLVLQIYPFRPKRWIELVVFLFFVAVFYRHFELNSMTRYIAMGMTFPFSIPLTNC